MVRYRKNSAAPLFFYSQSQTFKKSDDIPVCIAVKSAVKKLRVTDNRLKKSLLITGIGDIAASLSCNKQLFPKLFIFFKEVYLMVLFPQKDRRCHSGGASSYNYYFSHKTLL